MFRHRGERKVKSVEEEMDDVTSRTAELLEEGEELMGKTAKRLGLVSEKSRKKKTVSVVPVGDDSSSEDATEEKAGDGQKPEEENETKAKITVEGEEEEKCEEPAADTGAMESEESNTDEEKEDREEVHFPDTTISLSHLQPSR